MSARDNIFEECAEEVIDSAPCGFLSTLPDGTILRVNRTFLDWTGYERDALLAGQRFQEHLTVPGRIFYETHFAPLLRMQGFVSEIACHLQRRAAPPLPVLVSSRLKVDLTGRPLVVRTTVFDATDRTKYENALRMARREAERHAAIVNSSDDAMLSLDAEGRVQTWNPGAATMLGRSEAEMAGRSFADLVAPEQRAALLHALAAVRDGSVMRRDTVCIHRDGRLIDVSAHASRLREDEGAPPVTFLILRDIGERKRQEEQIQLLMREVDHRAKNMLTLVQVIARHTAKGDPATFGARFDERIRAVAAGQDLLMRNQWQGTDMEELVRAQLAHFGDLLGSRIRIGGPVMRLTAAVSQTVGLALHELATNAGKYGALSNDAGIVDVVWRLERRTVELSWTESGGPPVSPPARRGFGSTVLGSIAKLGGQAQVEFDFAPTGVAWRLRSPADETLE